MFVTIDMFKHDFAQFGRRKHEILHVFKNRVMLPNVQRNVIKELDHLNNGLTRTLLEIGDYIDATRTNQGVVQMFWKVTGHDDNSSGNFQDPVKQI